MYTEIYEWLASDNGYNMHWAVLTALILGGLGVPIPEDIPLVFGGMAAAKQIVSFQAIFLTCYLGVILADQLVFCAGFLFGGWLLDKGTDSPLFPQLTEERLSEVKEGLRKNRLLYIFISRHLFPIRSVTFLAAGALRVPFLEFLLADAMAALVSVSIMVWLGYFLAFFFGDALTLEAINGVVHRIHLYIIGLIALSIIIYFSVRWYRRRKRQDASKTS